jgi:hypothetical protein
MNDDEFMAYMTAAAEDRVTVSAAQIDRLRMLAGVDVEDRPTPPGWWGTVCPTNVAWAVSQARKRLDQSRSGA